MRDPHFCFVGAMFAQNPFCTKYKSKQRSVLHKIKTKIQFSNIYLSLSHCPMDPLLNGKIERKSDHLLDLPRAQLSDAINIVAVNRYFAILVLHCATCCGRLPFWYIVETTFHWHCGTMPSTLYRTNILSIFIVPVYVRYYSYCGSISLLLPSWLLWHANIVTSGFNFTFIAQYCSYFHHGF